MNTFVRCGQLFTGRRGRGPAARSAGLRRRGPTRLCRGGGGGAAARRGDRLIDHSKHFVMPGLIDVHTHLAYGNAKSEEDIDLYSPMEFRTLRGMFFAQKVAAAGYTAICSPGDAGQISPVDPQRDQRRAVRRPAGDGGRPLSHHAPGPDRLVPDLDRRADTSIGRLVTNLNEAIEEVRWQVKNGVDCIKLALDGIQRRPDGELIAAFTQDETDIIVRETHRMGRKAISHSVGREATLYSARAGVDLIFHGFDLDDECIAAMLKTGSVLCPTLTHPQNVIDFTQPHEPAAQKGRIEATEKRYRIGPPT